jgi:hypothetical protein
LPELGGVLKMSSRRDGFFISPTSCSNGGCWNETYVTIDSGKTWNRNWNIGEIITSYSLNDSCWYFVESTTTGADLFKSSTHFQTFQLLHSFNFDPESIYFIDTLNGVCGGDNIYYTQDGGLSWMPSTGLPAMPFVNNFSFIDANNGWALISNSIARTSNKGHSWIFIDTIQTPFTDCTQIQFTDSLNGYLLNLYGPEILKSTDGGFNWSNHLLNSPVHDFYFIDKNHGWFATDSGIIFTNDGLVTTTTQDPRRLAKISFVENSYGFVCGSELLLHSNQNSVLSEINNLQLQKEIDFIFPNPATEDVTIFSKMEICRIELFNVLGQKLFSEKVNDIVSTINLSAFPHGIYFVKIIYDHTTSTRRFIKL